MGHLRVNIIVLVTILLLITCKEITAQDCSLIPGVLEYIPINVNIKDIDNGIIYENNANAQVSEIGDIIHIGINNIYFTGSIADSKFSLSTSPNFIEYEEYETSLTVDLSVQITCTNGMTNQQLFRINIQDTNNNWPEFKPTNTYEFTIPTPILPGYNIGQCESIIVRDIDLTTTGIIFELSGSNDFEIIFDEVSSTEPKEFKAIIRTTTFISTLPESTELTITATDVDETGDPPLTSTASVVIRSYNDVSWPEEPVFSRTFYLGKYTTENVIILEEAISLQQGYHEEVEFSLHEEYAAYFEIIKNNNDVSLSVISPLPSEILTQQQIYIVVQAHREFTSGATTTLIVQLPEEITLQFEQSYYEGAIVDNELIIEDLLLTQGYEEHSVSLSVSNDNFQASINANRITLTKTPNSAIEGNAFLNLQVTASTERSSATVVVTLEIVNDDNTTPLFGKALYEGTYDPSTLELIIEPIELVQGYDDAVEITHDGDHANYFQLQRDGPTSILTVESLPPEVFNEQRQLTLIITATKPRTIGATAIVQIRLPPARLLTFEAPIYKGTYENGLFEHDTIRLNVDYDDDVTFSINSDFNSNFDVTYQENEVIILLLEPLPESVISENNFLSIILSASAVNAETTSTTLLIEIIKDDITTPVFNNHIYHATFSNNNIDIEDISLLQGYDSTVSIDLIGEHSQYFNFETIENTVRIQLTSPIPEDVILNEKKLFFNVIAEKPNTVGANAAIIVSFPAELTNPTIMRFSRNAYIGAIEDNQLTLEDISLISGYTEDTEFTISGDLESYFRLSKNESIVTLILDDLIPEESVPTNRIIELDIHATTGDAVPAVATIILKVISENNELVELVFAETYYVGSYSRNTSIEFDKSISLSDGYDENVIFDIEGDDSQYFTTVQDGNSVTLNLIQPIPPAILNNKNQLLFIITAQKPGSTTARSTIVISLLNEFDNESLLAFDRNNYVGSIESDTITLTPITLRDGYTEQVQFTLLGALQEYFSVVNYGPTVTIELVDVIPEQLIPPNQIIILDLRASVDDAVPAVATIVLEVVSDNESTVSELVFAQTYYVGSYGVVPGFVFENVISISEGFDDSVEFDLEGDDSQYFTIVQDGNSVTLDLIHPIPPAILNNNNQLLFIITAQKSGSTTARSTIVISLLNEFDNESLLAFDRNNYVGSIESDTITLIPITLRDGYTEQVQFTLLGALQEHFSVVNDGPTVTIELVDVIPEQLIPPNQIIILDLRASVDDAVPAVATIVLEVVSDNESTVSELVFAQTYYVGSYGVVPGFVFENVISISEGFDDSVKFDLEGDDSQYFTIVQDGNSVTLDLIHPIPPAILNNNNQLLFIITAQKSGSTTARSTIVISLLNEFDNESLLAFDRNNYVGSIESDSITLIPITLRDGYTEQVQFTLLGALQEHFSVVNDGPTVTIELVDVIPEQLIPPNQIIILDLRASVDDAVPAVATIVLEVVSDNESTVSELVFAQTYYVGSYGVVPGFVFENVISISEGFDDSVEFDLEGDDSQYFTIVQDGNSVTLDLIHPIPPAILNNNNQLLFIITAQKSGSTTARSTIVISLLNEFDNESLLAFDRNNYVGSIESDTITLIPITLRDGYTEQVQFTLLGALQEHFSVVNDGPTVTIELVDVIPEQLIPPNQIIILDLRASVDDAVPAVATIVLEVVSDNESTVSELVFAQTYYVGSYGVVPGFVFENVISISEGFDDSVKFDLEGDDSQYFTIVQDGNSVTLDLIHPIPPAILNNNNQLLFIITAQKSGSTTARSTIVISLLNEFDNESLLAFDRNNYVGSIESDTITLIPITLRDGYTEQVQFTLLGALQEHFSVVNDGPTVTIELVDVIPEQLIPPNQIIILDLRASVDDAVPAVATIVLEVVSDNESTVSELVFTQTYYVGSYGVVPGFVFENVISISEGFDDSVEFDLEGDDSQYFTIVQDGNSVTLDLIHPIPPAILNNNNQLLFIITAQKSGSTTARSTIVISLLNEFDNESLLAFDRNNYVGSIESDTITLIPITLRDGYTEQVQFTLLGALQEHFSVVNDGPTVTIELVDVIPEQLIPPNQIIILDLRASVDDAVPAVATIVLEVVSDNESTVSELVFAQTYYVGSYGVVPGFVFENVISISEGFDDSVKFDLEGDDSQYFTIVQDGNSVTLDLIHSIPPAILDNNNQLLFIITAQKSGSTTARSTIVISLLNEFDNESLLAFDRNNYVGSIESDTITLIPVTLRDGYTEQVQFTLLGALQEHFSVVNDGPTVTIELVDVIPEQLIPPNQIIILDLRASVDDAVPAVATIVLEVVSDNESTVSELVFAQTYYVGSYGVVPGFVFENVISISEGFDDSVEFDLEGDDSQYFTIVQDGNSVTLNLIQPIPPAILNNNNQLLFIITAQKPGSTTARSTIVISLLNDSDDDASFSNIVFEGVLHGPNVHHDTITLSGYSGTNVEIIGVYSSIFVAELSNGVVSIQTVSSAIIPTNVVYIPLELRAGSAGAVLILEVQEETHVPPSVTFTSTSYEIRVDISQSGFIGSVDATADNGEDIKYSLQDLNEHLQTRLSINNNGELYLSSQADSGVYRFQVIATTVFTQATGAASVYFTVDSVIVCGDDKAVYPLIVIDRDEEQEHKNLVVLNTTEHSVCKYRLTNRWPVDQNWLYVDETGLHTRAIDREHESIAFMTLSQVQVELVLECEGDTPRVKRSLDFESKSKSLNPDDYGTWVLTNTISYNSRRSFVNLIVNDINDNSPNFIGKENEPIVVGFPIPELEEIVLPRALAELEATDADIGDNAALMYWSSAPELAVSPWSGVVHVAKPLDTDLILTVNATDQHGLGLTGSLQLIVKLLDVDNIAIINVKNAFLEDERYILSNLTSALGYDVKVLRSSVVYNDSQDENNEEELRMKREIADTGISLQLYIYGVIQHEPISVDRLTEDIGNSAITAITITDTIRLEDYLEGRETCTAPTRDVGLLVATIVLSSLLFILIVAIAVWFFLKWRKDRNYKQFDDEDSIVSRNDSLSQLPKPESRPQPRINLEDLKRSERRLQEMIDAPPFVELHVEPKQSSASVQNNDVPVDTIIDMPLPDPVSAIVVQDKLKDADVDISDEDEFGETKIQGKKSMVTFNENVQKIIHVDDIPENNLNENVEARVTRRTETLIQEYRDIFTEEEYNSLYRAKHIHPKKLYGLPKIHKKNAPLRPIVSQINSPTYDLAKHVAKILQPLVVNECMEVVKDRLLEKDLPSQYSVFLKHCLDAGYFLYQGEYYLQIDGIAMGSPVVPLVLIFGWSTLKQRFLLSDH
ncbi:uncharacterized protein LOC131852664 [Achroia grisella]|uniref:uncharacterized protein LOC131852664 n=1 Tax=Achroia grisella TaxID=688607 RepID=UPI0027D1EADB|nr:uncharacterized protein LOC131852664 [Achroia grisella]